MTANPAQSAVDILGSLPLIAAAESFNVRTHAAAEALLECGVAGIQILFAERRLVRRSIRLGTTPFIFEPEIVANAPEQLSAFCAENRIGGESILLSGTAQRNLERFGRPPERPTGPIALLPFRMREDADGFLILSGAPGALLAVTSSLSTWTNIFAGLLANDLRIEHFEELDILARALRREHDITGVLHAAVHALAREYATTAQAWRRDRLSWLQMAVSPVGRTTGSMDVDRIVDGGEGVISLGETTGVPLVVDGTLWGALVVDTPFVTRERVEFLRAAAMHTQLALENAVAFERHRRFAVESAALSDAGRTLLGYTRIEPLAAAISRLAAELSDAGAATLYLEKNDGRFVRGGNFVRADESAPEISVAELQAVLDDYIPVIERDDRIILLPLGDKTPHAGSNLLRGCLAVQRSPGVPALSEETVRLLEAFATLGTLSLRNARSFEEAAEANRALADSNAFKDDLLAMFTHDFKGPLAVISGYGELVLEKLVGEERESVGIILAQVRRLATLADDALAVARAQATGFALDRQPGELVEFTRDLLQTSFGRLRARLLFEPRVTELQFAFDPVALRHILENVIGNALKYSQEDVRIEILRERTEAVLIVRDRGIGIPAAELAQVFGRFSRASNARMRGISGSGVGLYIANRLVEAHGGAIFVSSCEGEGSTFEVRLPVTITRQSRRKDDGPPASITHSPGGAERG